MLGDATRLTRHDVGVADGVEQRGLAVVDVAEHGDDRRARLEVGVVVFVVVTEQRLQLELGLLAGLDQQHLGAERLGDEVDHLVGQRLRAGDHLARVEQQPHEVGGGAVQLGRELLDGAAALDDDLALGDRRVGRRELRHRRGTEVLEVATTTLLAPGPLTLRAGPTTTGGTATGTAAGAATATAGTATRTATGTLEATATTGDRRRDAGSHRHHRRHRDAGSRRHHRHHWDDCRRVHPSRGPRGVRAGAGCRPTAGRRRDRATGRAPRRGRRRGAERGRVGAARWCGAGRRCGRGAAGARRRGRCGGGRGCRGARPDARPEPAREPVPVQARAREPVRARPRARDAGGGGGGAPMSGMTPVERTMRCGAGAGAGSPASSSATGAGAARSGTGAGAGIDPAPRPWPWRAGPASVRARARRRSGSRRSPSASARRRTRSAEGSSMLDEWLLTPILSRSARSSTTWFSTPSSLASS